MSLTKDATRFTPRTMDDADGDDTDDADDDNDCTHLITLRGVVTDKVKVDELGALLSARTGVNEGVSDIIVEVQFRVHYPF